MPYSYIDLDDLKLSVLSAENLSDTSRDALFDWARFGAARRIDEKTRGPKAAGAFTLDNAATARVYSTRGKVVCEEDGERLLVDDVGDLAGLVVEVSTNGTAWSTVAASTYEVEPANWQAELRPVTSIRYVYASWLTYRRVRVTAKWGWPSVPDDIVNANLIQAARWYRRKDSPEGVAGSAEWGLVRVPNLDPDVRAIIDDYAKPGFS